MHIGLHKTGTTQFQQFLTLNKDNLNCKNIACAAQPAGSDDFRTYYSSLAQFVWNAQPGGKEWVDQLANSHHHILFSSENIIGKYDQGKNGLIYANKNLYLERMIGLFPDDVSIDILVSIREYGSWLESSYLQYCKVRELNELITFEDYIKQSDIDIGKLSWIELMSDLVSIERISKIYVWPYESFRKDNELLYDFLDDYCGTKLDRPDRRTTRNPSLNAAVYEILMASGSLNNSDRKKLRNFLLETFSVSSHYARSEFLSADTRELLQDRYIHDLAKMEAQFANNPKVECLLFPG